jgi:hypothetical protein
MSMRRMGQWRGRKVATRKKEGAETTDDNKSHLVLSIAMALSLLRWRDVVGSPIQLKSARLMNSGLQSSLSTGSKSMHGAATSPVQRTGYSTCDGCCR